MKFRDLSKSQKKSIMHYIFTSMILSHNVYGTNAAFRIVPLKTDSSSPNLLYETCDLLLSLKVVIKKVCTFLTAGEQPLWSAWIHVSCSGSHILTNYGVWDIMNASMDRGVIYVWFETFLCTFSTFFPLNLAARKLQAITIYFR